MFGGPRTIEEVRAKFNTLFAAGDLQGAARVAKAFADKVSNDSRIGELQKASDLARAYSLVAQSAYAQACAQQSPNHEMLVSYYGAYVIALHFLQLILKDFMNCWSDEEMNKRASDPHVIAYRMANKDYYDSYERFSKTAATAADHEANRLMKDLFY